MAAANDAEGVRDIGGLLSSWVSVLGASQSGRLSSTFVELLLGAMMSDRGWITAAFLAVSARRGWKAYFWAIEEGRFRLVALIRAVCRVVASRPPSDEGAVFAIDDTFVPRSSGKAPGSVVTHQHGRKANRPDFMLGQTIVAVAAVVRTAIGEKAVPLAGSLPFAKGNGGKLRAAMVLLRTISKEFGGRKTLLMDSWYMKRDLVLHALDLGFRCVGMARIDTVFHEPPPPRTGRRGRPRKKGGRVRPESLPRSTAKMEVPVWGGRVFRWRTVVALADFLGLREVRAVWIEMRDPKDPSRWSKPRLLVSTDTTLQPVDLIVLYARRWTIETLFSVLKNGGGMAEVWMQGKRAFLRWLHVRLAACALAQLLALDAGAEVLASLRGMGWRKDIGHGGNGPRGASGCFSGSCRLAAVEPENTEIQRAAAPHGADPTPRGMKTTAADDSEPPIPPSRRVGMAHAMRLETGDSSIVVFNHSRAPTLPVPHSAARNEHGRRPTTRYIRRRRRQLLPWKCSPFRLHPRRSRRRPGSGIHIHPPPWRRRRRIHSPGFRHLPPTNTP